jgi:hypothetical protein
MTNHRRTAAAALAVVLASYSLYPIFTGTFWFWAGCGSVLVVALTGTATRIRRLPVILVLAIGLVALLLYLNLAFSNTRSLFHLLPTPASLADLWHIAGQGFDESSRYAPPVPGLRGMVLLAAAGIGITAVLTDLIAVRLRSAALAGLPLLLLFTEPFTLSVSRGFLGTAIAFCAGVAGYLALLSSEARDRIREWEHQDPAGRDEPDTRPLAAAGRRVGFASVVLALAVPLFVPGLHTTRLFGAGQPGIGGTGGNGGAAVVGFPNPNVQLSNELHTTQATPVLVYKTTAAQPDYLQIYALGDLTDKGWSLAPESLVPVGPRLPAPPGLTRTADTTTTTTQVSVAAGVNDDAQGALPVPYPATTVSAADGALRADRSTLMVFDQGAPLGGLSYKVTSVAESPSATSLDDAPAPPADITANYQSVPASYDSLRSLAASITKGATTPYQKAAALQNYLANGVFAYTLGAQSVVSAAGLTRFLEVTKTGYCQQFSFAMAVLARLVGIPSRIAYGFTAGTLESPNVWMVTTHDAHAWPELYFQGYGWLRFEPTPAGGEAGQATALTPGYANPGGQQGTSAAQTGSGATPTPTASGAANQQVQQNLHRLNGLGAGSGGAAASGGALNPWEVLGLVAAGLVILGAIAPWCARRVIRRRRWRRGRPGTGPADGRPGRPAGPGAPDRADQVRARDVQWAHAAWQELRDDLVDYGAGYQASESPRAVAARASQRLRLAEPAREALGRIAMAEERATYAPAPSDGSRLPADSAVVRQAIAAAVPRGDRWRARLLPSSVVGPALAAVMSLGERYRWARGAGTGGGGRRWRHRP